MPFCLDCHRGIGQMAGFPVVRAGVVCQDCHQSHQKGSDRPQDAPVKDLGSLDRTGTRTLVPGQQGNIPGHGLVEAV